MCCNWRRYRTSGIWHAPSPWTRAHCKRFSIRHLERGQSEGSHFPRPGFKPTHGKNSVVSTSSVSVDCACGPKGPLQTYSPTANCKLSDLADLRGPCGPSSYVPLVFVGASPWVPVEFPRGFPQLGAVRNVFQGALIARAPTYLDLHLFHIRVMLLKLSRTLDLRMLTWRTIILGVTMKMFWIDQHMKHIKKTWRSNGTTALLSHNIVIWYRPPVT